MVHILPLSVSYTHLGAIDSRLQQASFDEFPEFRIEKKEAVEDIVRYANGFVNYDLVKLWADESGAMVDWPVSYTHLDVYKRQPSNRPAS